MTNQITGYKTNEDTMQDRPISYGYIIERHFGNIELEDNENITWDFE